MKDPNKFIPGCMNKECDNFSLGSVCNCGFASMGNKQRKHARLCELMTCYNPKPKPEPRFSVCEWAGTRFIMDRNSGSEINIQKLTDFLNENWKD